MVMRIACEIMLDKKSDSPNVSDPDAVAEYVDDDLLPVPGQSIFVSTENGETEFVVTSTRAWHEDMHPPMGEREMSGGMTGADREQMSDR